MRYFPQQVLLWTSTVHDQSNMCGPIPPRQIPNYGPGCTLDHCNMHLKLIAWLSLGVCVHALYTVECFIIQIDLWEL